MRTRCVAAALALLWLVTAAAAAGAAGRDASPDPCAPVAGPAVAVADAVDGDTLKLADGRTIHVAGIESVKAGADPAVAALAAAARAELRRLVGDAVAVRPMSAVVSRDRWGRVHGDVEAQGGSVAAAVVAAGLARVRLFPGEKPCVINLLAAESAARAAGRGLWALPQFAVRAPDDPSLPSRTGLYELVEGRVASVGQGKSMVFLDFGEDYRRDFTVMVPVALAEQLPLATRALKGRRIRVRGVIEARGGPAIRLRSLDELELLDRD
jgi:micrococcal nuclease